MSAVATTRYSMSYFPILPEAAPSKNYLTVMQAVRAEYAKYEEYAKKPAEIEAEIAKVKNSYENWRDNKITDENREASAYDPKMRTYLELEAVRDETKRIADLYDKVIAECPPPALDTSTLLVLQKLGLSTEDMKVKYDAVFTTELNKLKQESEKMKKLYEELKESLKNLRYAFEPWSKSRSPDTLYSLEWTPYFNRDRDALKAQKPKESEKNH